VGKQYLMDDELKAAIKAAGGLRSLARLLGITHQAILQWEKVPAERILKIESITGVLRERLRGDLYRCAKNMNGARAEIGAWRAGDTMMNTAVYEAVENIRALDRRDAQVLADEIVDDMIAALQRGREIPPRSFARWSLVLADLCARIAERIANEIEGHIDRETALLELKAVTGWEGVLDA
jgi:DNA-binding transcriptional regulator YdaS (Cro superfamily)